MRAVPVYMIFEGKESLTTDLEVAKKIIEAIETNGHDWGHDDIDLLLEGKWNPKRSERVWLLNQYARAFNSSKQVFNHTFNRAPVSKPHFESVHDRRKKRLREATITKALSALGGEKKLIIVSHYHDEEYGGNQTSVSEAKLSSELGTLYDAKWNCKGLREYKKLDEVFDSLREYYSDHDYCSFVGTTEEYDKLKKEERRKELEGMASEIARKHNVQVNSLEFLAALDKEARNIEYKRERWNDGETRMEEWGACRAAGVGTDVYFDDLNFVNGRLSASAIDIYDIEGWISENCPLLYAQYTEQRMARVAAGVDEDCEDEDCEDEDEDDEECQPN